MANEYKILGQNVCAVGKSITQTTIYTVPAGKSAIISSIICTNAGTYGSSSGNQLRVYVVKNGQSAGIVNAVVYGSTSTNILPLGSTYTLTAGITLSAGDSIVSESANYNGAWEAAVNCQVFGTEIS